MIFTYNCNINYVLNSRTLGLAVVCFRWVSHKIREFGLLSREENLPECKLFDLGELCTNAAKLKKYMLKPKMETIGNNKVTSKIFSQK